VVCNPVRAAYVSIRRTPQRGELIHPGTECTLCNNWMLKFKNLQIVIMQKDSKWQRRPVLVNELHPKHPYLTTNHKWSPWKVAHSVRLSTVGICILFLNGGVIFVVVVLCFRRGGW